MSACDDSRTTSETRAGDTCAQPVLGEAPELLVEHALASGAEHVGSIRALSPAGVATGSSALTADVTTSPVGWGARSPDRPSRSGRGHVARIDDLGAHVELSGARTRVARRADARTGLARHTHRVTAALGDRDAEVVALAHARQRTRPLRMFSGPGATFARVRRPGVHDKTPGHGGSPNDGLLTTSARAAGREPGARRRARCGHLCRHAAPRLGSRFPSGALGVDIFFALSAFLITTLLMQEKVERHCRLRRVLPPPAFRLLPALLIFLVVIALPTALLLHEGSTVVSSTLGSLSTRTTFFAAMTAAGSAAHTHTHGHSPSRSSSIWRGPSWSRSCLCAAVRRPAGGCSCSSSSERSSNRAC